MASIYRRKQIRRLTTLVIIGFLFFISVMIFFFFPYGLHKSRLTKINIPKETAIYLSLKNIDSTINKFVNSTYAYRASYDETLFDLSITLKSIQSFLLNFSNNKNIFISIASKYANSRNTAILVWNKDKRNYDLEYNAIYIFDIGKIPTLFLNLIKLNDITLLEKKYTIEKNKSIRTVSFDSKKLINFTFYKGLVIVSKNEENLDDLISFLKKKNKKNEIEIFERYNKSDGKDILLYVNKQVFDTLNYNENGIYKVIDYFSGINSFYISTELLSDRVVSDVYADFREGKNNRYPFHNNGGVRNIMKYFSIEETTLFFAINAQTSKLYPLVMSDLKKNSPINNTLYSSMLRLDNMYSINMIAKEINNEISFAYVRNKNKDVNYPLFAFEITNEIHFTPFFENILNKKYGAVKKNERSYKSNFIYKYDIPTIENKLYYMSKNNIFFMSEEQEAIEIIIDNLSSKKFMDWYITSDGIQNTPPNVMLRFHSSKGKDIIKDMELSFRTWVYPYDVIMYTWTDTNSTHFRFTFYANLKPIKID